MLGDVAFDRGLQVGEAGEGSTSQSSTREGGEDALDGIEPGSRGRCEVIILYLFAPEGLSKKGEISIPVWIDCRARRIGSL